jgi:hypothetical protein
LKDEFSASAIASIFTELPSYSSFTFVYYERAYCPLKVIYDTLISSS